MLFVPSSCTCSHVRLIFARGCPHHIPTPLSIASINRVTSPALDFQLISLDSVNNRYSMPATGLSSQLRSNLAGFGNNNTAGLDSFSAAKYLFHNEDDRATLKDEDRLPTPDIKSYLKMTDPDDKFPTLSRRDDNSGLVSLSWSVTGKLNANALSSSPPILMP